MRGAVKKRRRAGERQRASMFSQRGASTILQQKNFDDKGILGVARDYVAAGISILPIRADGSKHAGLDIWKPLQSRLPTDSELQEWFDSGEILGIGTIGGSVSGGLEQLDFDHDADSVYAQWAELVEAEHPGLVASLTTIRTPKNGYHIKYRVNDFTVPGSAKLATSSDRKTIIETRGEGGYCIAPGSPAECHKSGKTYEHIGGPFIPPTITKADRDCLVRCCLAFDEMVETAEMASSASPSSSGLRPGDDFDLRGPDWSEILEMHGWRCAGRSGNDGVRYWRRPGKIGPGWSATTGRCKGSKGEELFRVFSTNAHPFIGGRAYGKFRTFALLNHDGNLSAAAAELSRQNYGSNNSGPKIKIGGSVDGEIPRTPKNSRPLLPYTPFPTDALPALIREYVCASAAAIGCDESLVALPVLAAVAGCIGATRAVRLRKGWAEPAIVWSLTIAESGALKSPAFAAALDPLMAIQMERVSDADRAREAYEAELRRARKEKADEPKPPPPEQCLVTSETTIEALGLLLKTNPRGILLARDELDGWFSGMTKYKSGSGATDRPHWLEMHRGGALRVHRVSRPR